MDIINQIVKKKLNLSNITLFCYENRYIDKAIEAIEICKHYADFGSIKFITNNKTGYEHEIIDNTSINSLSDYSRFILFKLNGYVDTDFVLTVHADGFITNPLAWTNEFLSYDYIGATWYNQMGLFRDNKYLVGNGGFSLRSKKLLNELDYILPKINNPRSMHNHEDIVICHQLRDYLESRGIRFAPIEIADKFSVETKGKWNGEFGFHNFKFVNPENFGWVNPLKNNC